MVRPKRFELWWVSLDPTLGAELKKTRPAVVLSPDDHNGKLLTALVAPLTSTLRGWPFRVRADVAGTPGEIALDQLRCVAHARLRKKIGVLDRKTAQTCLRLLQEVFSE